ncbi:MAG: hypothetical protein HYY22_03610 [Thaumarchaeota archaeon]|nr:hypothetical protein [Nitrososphaerota archaeon]
MNPRLLGGCFGTLLIVGLLYPATLPAPRQEFTIGIYYLYHFDSDLPVGWRENISAAMDTALSRLNTVDLLDNYHFTYKVADALRINKVEFGNGTKIPEFDGNRTMNRILQELISPDSGFQKENTGFNLTIFVFPLSKCISKQYSIISTEGISPIFLSYNGILAETHFNRFIIEHEILHTFGLPDRRCSDNTNCRYPDDNRSVMAEHPAYFYLSRSDYDNIKPEGLKELNLRDTANNHITTKPYDPRLEEDGSCPSGIKATREWRLVHDEQ